ncbi:hypothetical protein BdWA1_000039 [Babesia duncani]|uniref:Uncharacterized protein n=1 Tax=Babesia duncani TaxID=323732 RepID=A0AAD9PLN8_9APIC|nr:hypothetical protein BdWA1_000039 [Babesia duncani]
MRSAWTSFNRAVNELNTFKQRLLTDSITENESEVEQGEENDVGQQNLDYESSDHNGTVTPRAINHNDGDDLSNFTNSILSQYITKSQQQPLASVPSVVSIDAISENPVESLVNMQGDLSSSVGLYHRMEVLYNISKGLNKLYHHFLPHILESCRFKHFESILTKPPSWNRSGGIHNEYTKEIFKCIETSSNILYALITTLNIDKEAFQGCMTGSLYLQALLDHLYSSNAFAKNLSTVWSGTSDVTQLNPAQERSECLKLLRFISDIQLENESRIEQLREQRDEALASKHSSIMLHEQLNESNAKIVALEEELKKRDEQIEQLKHQLFTVNDSRIVMIKELQELKHATAKMQMEQQGLVSKITIANFIEEYYKLESGTKREDIIKLLENLIGIDMEPKTREQQHQGNSLVQQFIKFINEDMPTERSL